MPLLALVLVLLTAAGAAAAAPPADAACREGARVVRSQPGASPLVRTAAVVCTAGRSRVVRRAVLRENLRGKPVAGTLITDAAAAGRRVAIASLRFRTGGRAAHVDVLDRRTRRVLRRRAAGRRGARPVEVVLLDRGEVAWTTMRGEVVLDRGRGVERVGARGHDLAVEDGRTLRWDTALGTYRFFDVRPWPGPGCPPRSGHAVVADNGAVLVTRARLRHGDVLRACLIATGEDRVVAADLQRAGVATLSGDWLLVVEDRDDVRDACVEAAGRAAIEVRAVNARTGVIGRRGMACSAELPPGRGAAVTASGAPAWIRADPASGEDVLRTISDDGRLGALDRAPPGALGGLRAEGDGVVWSRGGVELRARL